MWILGTSLGLFKGTSPFLQPNTRKSMRKGKSIGKRQVIESTSCRHCKEICYFKPCRLGATSGNSLVGLIGCWCGLISVNKWLLWGDDCSYHIKFLAPDSLAWEVRMCALKLLLVEGLRICMNKVVVVKIRRAHITVRQEVFNNFRVQGDWLSISYFFSDFLLPIS